jgi:hypothetical protein
MHTYLLYQKSTDSSWKRLADIKDYPATGGSPEQIESTTLSDETSTFVLGVQSLPSFEFLANYDPDVYKTLNDLADGSILKFALAFGKPDTTAYGGDGNFQWEGQLSVWAEGGGVNAVREMRIATSVTTQIAFSKNPLTVTAS